MSCAARRAWYSASRSTPCRRICFASLTSTSREPVGSKSFGKRTRRPGSTLNGAMNEVIRFGPRAGTRVCSSRDRATPLVPRAKSIVRMVAMCTTPYLDVSWRPRLTAFGDSAGPRDLRCGDVDDGRIERRDEVTGGKVDVDPEVPAADRNDRQVR